MTAKCFRHWAGALAVVCWMGAMGAPMMRAGTITIGTAPFAGIETNLRAVGNQSVPFTDAFGRVVTGGNNIFDGSGLFTRIQTVVFSNLAADTYTFGLTTTKTDNYYIASVSFNNGDSIAVGAAYQDLFLSFSGATPFTAATVVFGTVTGGSGFIRDFRTAAALTSAPEPGSLLLMTIGVAFLVAGVWRRSRNTPVTVARHLPGASRHLPANIFRMPDQF